MKLQELDALKARLDALRPLPQAALRNLHDELVLRWTYHANAIEGNTHVDGDLTDLIALVADCAREGFAPYWHVLGLADC